MRNEIIENVYKIVFEALENNIRLEKMIQELCKKLDISILLLDIYGENIAAEYKRNKMNNNLLSIGKDTIISLMSKYHDLSKEKCITIEEENKCYILQPIKVRDNVEGYCLTCDDLRSTMESTQINDLISRMVALYFKMNRPIGCINDNAEKAIVARFLLGKNQEELFAIDEKVYSKYVKNPFVLCVFKLNDTVIQEKIIRKKLNDNIENNLSYMEKDILFVLFSDVKDEERVFKITGIVEELCVMNNIFASISSIFYDVKDIFAKQKILERIIDIGRSINPTDKLYKEYDYFLEVVCSYAIHDMYNQEYCSYELNLLEKEDEEKGTEFYKSLKEYLLCGNNVNLAAKKIYIHRNTMVYRLGKIHEIMKIDINNPDVAKKLLISMGLRSLIKKADCKNNTNMQ